MRAALSFLTPLPLGATVPTTATLRWFPVAGAAMGLALGGAWWAASEAFPALVAAAFVVVADLLLTGALHADGLADSADGLLGHLPTPVRRKEVMAGPDVGAFAVAAVAGVLLLRWSALASVEPDAWLLAALWAASRAAMAVSLAAAPYVGGGLGTAFLAPAGGSGLAAALTPLVGGVVVAAACVAAAPGMHVVAGLGGVVVGAAAVVALARRRLGGVTGDVAGAAGLVGETVGLVLATAAW